MSGQSAYLKRTFNFATNAVKKYSDFLAEAVYGESAATFLFIRSEIGRVEPDSLTGQVSFAICDRADYVKSWKEEFKKAAKDRVELDETDFEFSATDTAEAASA